MDSQLQIIPVEINGRKLESPIFVSGPCSAETEEQVLETGRKISEMGIPIYRAGIWKPRTRPGNFEGLGAVALPWLAKLKEETGLLIATEVANPYHIKEAINYGVDILWIGARTTTNPFMVQELADYLRGLDIAVFVKNPINPDIDLWIGALERMNKAGLKKLVAIHRGFSFYGPSLYRNKPQWGIPIELKRRFPDLPIIVDPSHICGRRDLLREVCQKAVDLNFDGLFIESHINPERALSDKEQQVVPEELKKILASLVWRKPDITDRELKHDIELLRDKIDRLDDELLHVFEARMKVVERIAEFKKVNDVTILQADRWSEILNERKDIGNKLGLSEEFVMSVFKAIHLESINKQTRIMNREIAEKSDFTKYSSGK